MNNVDLKEIYEILDLRYVIRSDCASKHEQLNDEMTELKMQNADTKVKLNIIIKIGSAAAVAAVGAFATALCSLIFK